VEEGTTRGAWNESVSIGNMKGLQAYVANFPEKVLAKRAAM
jgi:hypothetical protein